MDRRTGSGSKEESDTDNGKTQNKVKRKKAQSWFESSKIFDLEDDQES